MKRRGESEKVEENLREYHVRHTIREPTGRGEVAERNANNKRKILNEDRLPGQKKCRYNKRGRYGYRTYSHLSEYRNGPTTVMCHHQT